MKKRVMMAICAAVTFMSFGCDEEENKEIMQQQKQQEEVAKERVDVVLNKSLIALNGSSNKFAIKIFDEVCKKEKANLFMSPYSVQLALSLVANGADGNTLEEMLSTLGFDEYDIDLMNLYNKVMMEAFITLDNTTKVEIANGVWGMPEVEFCSDFKKNCQDSYDAEIATGNFLTGEAQKAISDWAEQKTHGMIKNAGRDLDPETMVAIANSLYFNGKWACKFDKNDTQQKDFTCADGSKKKVDMMQLFNEDFEWKKEDNYEVLNMPYGNGAFSMTILLPDEGEQLDDILSQATLGTWDTSRAPMASCNVQFPRFEMDSKIGLTETLKDMGMKQAFTQSADFSKMSSYDLKISKVYQLAKIKVDEEGTEAAAVTVVGMDCTSVGPSPEIHDFFVNRPFAFCIKEKSTDAILFMGKVTELDRDK